MNDLIMQRIPAIWTPKQVEDLKCMLENQGKYLKELEEKTALKKQLEVIKEML